MELKEFKEGVAFLAKLTNQRKAEPENFMVQVGADTQISLIAGDQRGTYVWRTGMTSDAGRMREGIPSKPLVQATKVLKGSSTVSLSVTKNGLDVRTSEGGSLTVPFSDSPDLARLVFGAQVTQFNIPSIAGLSAEIEAVTDDKIGWDYVQLSGTGLLATNERKLLSAYLPGMSLLNPTAHRATFWEPLSGLKTDGEALVFESGIRVLAGRFEASTPNVAVRNVPDLSKSIYPEGSRPDNLAVMDRKVLIGSLKALGNTVEISHLKTMINLTDSTNQQVGLSAKQSFGDSSIKFGKTFMTDILSALTGKEVIVMWQNDARKPLRITDAGNQAHVFLVAPVWRA